MSTLDILAQVQAVCPVLSIDNTGAGWRFTSDPSATEAQRAAGNALIDAINASTPHVPLSVNMWQAKAALAANGLLDGANAAVEQVGNPTLLIAWQNATVLSRESPGMAAIGVALGLDNAKIDQLFIEANRISI